MATVRLRSLTAVLMTLLCAVALALMPVVSGVATRVESFIAQIALLAGEDLGWVMGGTINPLPDPWYLNAVRNLYLNGQAAQGLSIPNQFCPIVCVPSNIPGGGLNLPTDLTPAPPNILTPDGFFPQSLTFGSSVDTGAGILNNAIRSNIDGSNTVLGYSQSATVATVVMQHLAESQPAGLNPADQHFVLLGNPNNPLGGILTRFQFPDSIITGQPQHVPFLNIPLSIGATPTDAFPTDIYTGQYDGWANFPRDPLNVLADLNALIGIGTVHPYYPDPTPGVNLDIGNIIHLGTIDQTNFYSIPAPMPMLAFMYDGGPAGQFFYNAFNPWLSLINNWGYGNSGDPGAMTSIAELNPGASPQDLIGPWQVNALGGLEASGVAGFFNKMDPLQLLAGMQNASVQTLVGPIQGLVGDTPFMQDFTDALNFISGYDLVNTIDQFLLSGWDDLAGLLQSGLNGLGLDSLLNLDPNWLVDLIGPAAIFDGGPLIPGWPLMTLVGLGFDLFNIFGA